MATRSTISLLLPTGQIKTIYAHWDGYLSHNGKILLEHYTTREKIEALLDLGALSVLAESIEKPKGHSFDKAVSGYNVFYGRDRGEDGVEARIYTTFEDIPFEEYNYLFKDDVWYVDRGKNGELIPLEEAIKRDEE